MLDAVCRCEGSSTLGPRAGLYRSVTAVAHATLAINCTAQLLDDNNPTKAFVMCSGPHPVPDVHTAAALQVPLLTAVNASGSPAAASATRPG